MKAQLSTQIAIAIFGLMGATSIVHPASAIVGNRTITNQFQSTLDAKVTNTTNINLQETTNTAISNLAGASSDSQTQVEIGELKQLEIPKLTNIDEMIIQEGSAQFQGEISKNGIKTTVDIDKTVSVGKIVKARICLDGEASVGSSGSSSLANCGDTKQVQSVPEPTAIAGFLLLGSYFVYHRQYQKKA